ncbi:hypothetical protein BGX26_007325, partial [Mortierella sp. AD094]
QGSSLSDIASLSSANFFANHASGSQGNQRSAQDNLVLDGASYHRVDTAKIPNGYAEVDVLIDDNGIEIQSKMTAGQIGMQICSSGDTELSSTGERDTIKPASAWWIFTTLPE